MKSWQIPRGKQQSPINCLWASLLSSKSFSQQIVKKIAKNHYSVIQKIKMNMHQMVKIVKMINSKKTNLDSTHAQCTSTHVGSLGKYWRAPNTDPVFSDQKTWTSLFLSLLLLPSHTFPSFPFPLLPSLPFDFPLFLLTHFSPPLLSSFFLLIFSPLFFFLPPFSFSPFPPVRTEVNPQSCMHTHTNTPHTLQTVSLFLPSMKAREF